MKNRRSILIIEDNDSFRRLMDYFLSKRYRVIAKKNGIDAMHWLGKGHTPDLILLDLGLPTMPGLDFLNGLKTSGFFKNIPVIVISGSHRENFTMEALDDVRHYFEKPFDPRKLQEKIDAIFSCEKTNETTDLRA